MENFSYCPTVWHFCSAKDKHKIEKIQECFVYSDYCSSHSELLDKAQTCTLELRQIHFICTEIYKTINNIRPEYMNSLVIPNQSYYSSRRPLNLFVPRINQTTYGLRSFHYQGTVLWNSLLKEIKTASNLNSFKKLIKSWEGPQCRRDFCSYNRGENQGLPLRLADHSILKSHFNQHFALLFPYYPFTFFA